VDGIARGEEDEEQQSEKVSHNDLDHIEDLDVDSFMRGDFITPSDGEQSGRSFGVQMCQACLYELYLIN